jgi:hypothetical protein
LFLSQLIYEHGWPWCNDIDRRNFWFVHQNSIALLPAEPPSSKADGTGEGNEFFLTKSLFHTSKGSLICCKLLRHLADGLLSFRRKTCCGFLLPSKAIALGGITNPRTLGPVASTLTARPSRMTI